MNFCCVKIAVKRFVLLFMLSILIISRSACIKKKIKNSQKLIYDWLVSSLDKKRRLCFGVERFQNVEAAIIFLFFTACSPPLWNKQAADNWNGLSRRKGKPTPTFVLSLKAVDKSKGYKSGKTYKCKFQFNRRAEINLV